MHLVDEGDNATFRGLDLVECSLHALLELAAVLRSRDHRSDVERDQTAILETLRDVAVHDPLGQSFDNRGLSCPRLTDDDGVVLFSARQNLDDPPYFVVPADDGVEITSASVFGEVPAVLLERSEGVLGVLACDRLAASYFGEGAEDRLLRDSDLSEIVAHRALRYGEGDEDVLNRDVAVSQDRFLALSVIEDVDSVLGESDIASSVHGGHRVEGSL